MNAFYTLTLGKLGNLSLEVQFGEYLNLDLLTEVRIFQWFVSPDEVRRLPSYSS